MEKQLELRAGITLRQDSRFFALGEDTMLLSHFAAPKMGGLGLDLGAGQGFLGILVGLCGLIMAALAYPLYNRTLKKERERIAPEILRLSDELLQ